jgi:hypothetical protein
MRLQPPGNLKKPESIQEWWDNPEKQAAAREALTRHGEWTKLLGAVDRVVAYDVNRQDLLDSDTRDEQQHSAGAFFVQWLMQHYDFPDEPGSKDQPVLIYAFEPKPLMRIAGQNAIRAGMRVPLGLWYSGVDYHCLDPMQMLLESSVKGKYDLSKICFEAPCGPIPLPGADGEVKVPYRTHHTPETDLKVVTELCVRYNLLPEADDRALREKLSEQPEMRLCDPLPADDGEAEADGGVKAKSKSKKK